ncbi:hypothetical protein [Micromonospora sp. NPDC049240]
MFLAAQTLERANKLAGVFGVFFALAGVGLSVYELIGEPEH